jgi:aldose 1-epimerase
MAQRVGGNRAVRLAAHDWMLDLLPELGGSIGALRHAGREVLRPAPVATRDVLETGCFPLVPYANRIAHGCFQVGGTAYRLPLNFGEHPHSLHGSGWQAQWRTGEAGAGHATLIHEHDASAGWPWRYRAEQRFELMPGAFRIELAVTNDDPSAMPAGLGLHPYFPIEDGTRLAFRASSVWLSDETMLPTVPVPPDTFGDWTAPREIAGTTLIDNAYEGWTGALRIDQPWGGVELVGETAGVLHLYRPPGERFFCAEPVSHLPDAVNRGGLPMLAPGGTRTLAMTIRMP